ncbi:hemocyte protein-glutamine gamma-glutamyltransferase-like [Mercenaria mercenaria]|uniref:hemocyte protein-glutamine gamma-glutamyltransferase-like n=1 Tax=Mercenaria mercenaria TaxID=6596 RepID=UPI00234E726E|nr:hemocyte protein-glutamine gamma-glutamyltransferase-like [Mercenaria mercenaria]
MGITFGKKKKVVRTIVLTPPTLGIEEEVILHKPSKQTIQQGTAIRDKNVPLYIRKLHTWAWENAHHHHTKKFTLPKSGTLVVRRGQPFKITLTFNRPYNSLNDELKFYFETGDKPLPGNDTMICMSSYTSQGSSGWKSDFLPVIGTKNRDCIEANLWIFTPADCIVSDWKFSLQSILRTETETATVTYEHPDRIYVLFNPWCKNDAVYLPAEPLLDEYIMNSAGIMFTGCRKRMNVKPWVFGQFESGILEACLYIIKRGFNFRTNQSMGDPVAVTRNISAIINAEDNNGGVLKGRWSTNDFTDGRPPTTWSGSVAILKQYLENVLACKGENPEPVRYGQCFVYAGLVATICRAVGIPCRCVTNYNSGRGTDGRLAIDFYYEIKEDGTIEEVEDDDDESDDLVWNFHVWNDVWMRRTDVAKPCNEPDWQALDATPQISSTNGLHSCGPAPLHAVKNGLTDIRYDVSYIFAEVNADVLHWLKVDMGNWTVFNVEETRIGQSISSKTPDGRPAILSYKYNLAEMSRIRQDVTSDYKYKKGTKMEKEVVQRPARKARPMHRCKAKDIQFRLADKDYEYIGDDFNIKANITSYAMEERTVQVMLLCESVHYNGKRHKIVKQKQCTIKVPPGENEQLQLGVYEEDYIGKLAEHTCMRQVGYLRVQETDQIEACVDDFLLQKPHLEMTVQETVYKGTNFPLKLFFKNPLHRTLKNCTVSVEGVGLESMMFIKKIDNVPAQCEWTGIVNLMPVKSKNLDISATFHCREMFDIIGTLVVKVEHEREEQKDILNRSIPSDATGSVTIPNISTNTSRVSFHA